MNKFSGSVPRHYMLAMVFFTFTLLSACDPVENAAGDNLSLCYDYYQQCVSPLLNTAFAGGSTCATSGCHLIGGGGGGSFHIEATGNIDSFTSALSMTNLFDKDNSRILFMPNNPAHTGGVYPALAQGSVCYKQIRDWLDIVVTEQPADQRPNDPCSTMPVCSVADAAAC